MEYGNAAKLNVETGCQFLARLRHHPSLADLEPTLFPDIRPSEVIEICGRAGSGKTEMLYHLAATCILPAKWHDTALGGMGIGVLFLDTDYCFSLERLVCILEARVSSVVCLGDRSLMKNFIRDCLERLFVVQCSSSEQLLVTLHSLETTLPSNKAATVLMIDSISAYYWWDRMKCRRLQDLDKYYSNLIGRLDRLVRSNGLTVFATKQALMKSADADRHPDPVDVREAPEFMGRHWRRFVTRRLFLSKEPPDIVILKMTQKGREVKHARITDGGIIFCSVPQS